MPLFSDLAKVARSIAESGSRSQIEGTVKDFIDSLDAFEAPIAVRLIAGETPPEESGNKLAIGRNALWRVAEEITGQRESAEEIFASAGNFGEAVEMLMRRRAAEPPPVLSIAEVALQLEAIASVSGPQSRARKLGAFGKLLALMTSGEANFFARIVTGEMRRVVRQLSIGELLTHAAVRGASGSRLKSESRLGPRALAVSRAKTLNLVIVTVEAGHGSHRGQLSKYHLAARGDRPDQFVEVALAPMKLNDEQLEDLNGRLEAIEISRSGKTMVVRPEIVVEVAYDAIRKSPSGKRDIALRAPRIVRLRGDLSAREADTLERIASDFAAQPSLGKPIKLE